MRVISIIFVTAFVACGCQQTAGKGNKAIDRQVLELSKNLKVGMKYEVALKLLPPIELYNIMFSLAHRRTTYYLGKYCLIIEPSTDSSGVERVADWRIEPRGLGMEAVKDLVKNKPNPFIDKQTKFFVRMRNFTFFRQMTKLQRGDISRWTFTRSNYPDVVAWLSRDVKNEEKVRGFLKKKIPGLFQKGKFIP